MIYFRTTFELTSQDDFNLQFNDTNRKFTLFAPSNYAWERLYYEAPSEHKKLKMGGYGYHVGKIIQRHTIGNRAFTIEQLRALSNDTNEFSYPIQAIHGMLRVNHKDDVDWKKQDINIRKSVCCTSVLVNK